jgi:hypothetical protein
MSAPSHAATNPTDLDLAALRRMTFEELDTLYRKAKRPATLSDLNGDGQGAMLAWRTPRSGPFASLLRSMGTSSLFPWKGKTFLATEEDDGEGINRVSLFGQRRWFPFGTRFDASFMDGKPTFVLDYGNRRNPPLIKQIVDEVREVSPRLYMGPAALKVGGKPRHILFFAVSFQ